MLLGATFAVYGVGGSDVVGAALGVTVGVLVLVLLLGSWFFFGA